MRFAKDIRGTFIEVFRARHGHTFALVIRLWLLSEKRNGSDVDMALTKANGSIRFTSWIPRG